MRRADLEKQLLGDSGKSLLPTQHQPSAQQQRPSSCLAALATRLRARQRNVLPTAILASVLALALLAFAKSPAAASRTTGAKDKLLQAAMNPSAIATVSTTRAGEMYGTSVTRPPHSNADIWRADLGAELPLSATLDERLQDWEHTTPQAEAADWVRYNLQTCPLTRARSRNNHMIDEYHIQWATLNSSALVALRQELITHLREVKRSGALDEKHYGAGKGIVFVAGNADTFERVALSLRLLRRHLGAASVPVEVFSFPGEEPSEALRNEMENELKATLRVVRDAYRDTSRRKNYHLKSRAIIESSFRQVLYLDSDNYPTANLSPAELVNTSIPVDPAVPAWTDPSGLWEGKAYSEKGVMLWPDYWRTEVDNPIWAVIGTGCRDEWEQEAGQLLIDKSKHLDALHLTAYMMDSSRFSFWYQFSDGDKDLFRFALLALRKRWAVPGRFVGVGAAPRNFASGFSGHTMLQHDHLGRPTFVHANLLKQIPSGIRKGFAWGQTKSMPLFSSDKDESLVTPARSVELEVQGAVDHGASADDLANADHAGLGASALARSSRIAPVAVRRRAALERGLSPFFHGGWISAIAINVEWHDPRSDDERAQVRRRIFDALPPAVVAGDGKEVEGEIKRPASADEVSDRTTRTGDGVEMTWQDPLVVRQWRDDVRLRSFEETFFALGGKLSGKGF